MGIRTPFSPMGGGSAAAPSWKGKTAFQLAFAAAGQTFTAKTAPTLASGHLSATIDWGDGSVETWKSGNPTHTYVKSGAYTVIVSDDLSSLSVFLAYNQQVTSILSIGNLVTNMGYSFYGCSSLAGSPVLGAGVTGVGSAYYGCSSLTGYLPPWPTGLTSASCCYANCIKIAGCSAALLADPMPAHIASHSSCVIGCNDTAVRQYFTAEWGGTKA